MRSCYFQKRVLANRTQENRPCTILFRKVPVFCCSLLLLFTVVFTGCGTDVSIESTGDAFTMGFASEEIAIPETEEPLYIAGYHQGVEITGVRDLCRASALWIDTGSQGVLLIGIDCIGLSSQTVETIRAGLKSFCKEVNCASVNVYATHTHESVDTLGLWGPTGLDGKNEDYQKNLVRSAQTAAKKAYENRKAGALYYGSVEAGSILKDSRSPQVYDTLLHQFRFVPSFGGDGIRVLFYGAHAEAMRSESTLVSRDYPGVLSDAIKDATSDDVLYVPSAIGGLIMTKELTKESFDSEKNVLLTGQFLAEKALSIKETQETLISPTIKYASTEVIVPLDNPVFMYYQFLGVVDYDLVAGSGKTGYSVRTSVSLLALGDVAIVLLPCELFPELLTGEALSSTIDPKPISKIAADSGYQKVLVAGLCNNELGYVVPPSYYLVNQKLPYLSTIKDNTGEDHYEETNSVGKGAAKVLLEGVEKLFRN